MENTVRNNVESMLNEEIDSYFKKDPKGLFVTGSEVALQFFSREELDVLEEVMEHIDDALFNLLFLTDESDVLSLDEIHKQITENIVVSKANERYIFIKCNENEHIIFDIITSQHPDFFKFDDELSRFFPREKTNNPQKIIKPQKSA